MASDPVGERPFLDYVRAAFLLPGNLMVFGGVVLGALLSPDPLAFLALGVAGEAVFLGALTSHARFRTYVDAQGHTPAAEAAAAPVRLEDVLAGLDAASVDRFTRLRERCKGMRALATTVQRADPSTAAVVGSLRTSGIDSLLWGFLRLLKHHGALRELLRTLDRADLDRRVASAKADLQRAEAAQDERLKNSHTERLATLQARVDYHDRTSRDADFLQVELDRVEEKILALSEMAVNQANADMLSAEIDAAASSMQATESSLSSLHTGTLTASTGPAPSILDADASGMQAAPASGRRTTGRYSSTH